jgi:hypothetical protein
MDNCPVVLTSGHFLGLSEDLGSLFLQARLGRPTGLACSGGRRGIDHHPLIRKLAIGVTRELRGYLPDFPSWPDVFRRGDGWF